MKTDLHIRTNFSGSADKSLSYQKVLQLAKASGLGKISITDFDTCIFHVINHMFDNSEYFDGQIIPGMECDVCVDGKIYELLVYNFDVIKTFDWSYQIYGTKDTRQQKIKDLLIKAVKDSGLVFDYEAKFEPRKIFAHNFVYEVLSKYEQNMEFFNKYNITNQSDFYKMSTSNVDFPLYVNLADVMPDIKLVVDFIHSVGGTAFLANPAKHKIDGSMGQVLSLVTQYGLDGVEVFHPNAAKEDIAVLKNYVKEHNLLMTGGSNFNGTPKFNQIGIDNICDDDNLL